MSANVWVGVLVACFFNLRFGWSLAGFVVPGFIAPLYFAKPLVAFINIFEGIIAYLLLKQFTNIGLSTNRWGTLFGREDKFFAVILSAIFVRVIFDGLIFPPFTHYLQEKFHYQFDYGAHIHSYGILVVALIANLFYESNSIRKALIPFAVNNLVTYLIIRYGLMEFTNFRATQITGLFENIGEIFEFSAKTYIIILVTTLLANRMTIKYGWDLGGIFVPSLFALTWFNPARVCATIIESLIIYFTYRLISTAKYFANADIIKARKILSFFTIGLFYRIVIGDVLFMELPEQRTMEFYGFGYILCTLIAITMHDNMNATRTVAMLIFTSFGGFAIGSLIALLLVFVPGSTNFQAINYPAPIWANPLAKKFIRASNLDYLPQSHFNVFDIPVINSSIRQYIQENKINIDWHPDEKLKEIARQYITTGDIVLLKKLVSENEYIYKHLVLNENTKNYLAIHNKDGELLGILNLQNYQVDEQEYLINHDNFDTLDLSNNRWIIFRSAS